MHFHLLKFEVFFSCSILSELLSSVNFSIVFFVPVWILNLVETFHPLYMLRVLRNILIEVFQGALVYFLWNRLSDQRNRVFRCSVILRSLRVLVTILLNIESVPLVRCLFSCTWAHSSTSQNRLGIYILPPCWHACLYAKKEVFWSPYDSFFLLFRRKYRSIE